MNNGIAIAICLITLAMAGWAGASSWLVRTWDTDDGLPQNSIASLAQARDGRLWIGTLLGGVANFDGVRFKSFDPSNTPELRRLETVQLVAGGDGSVWICQLGGAIARWDRGVFCDETPDDWSDGAWIEQVFEHESVDRLAVRITGEVLRRSGLAEWESLDLGGRSEERARFFQMDASGRLYFRTGTLGLAWWQDGESGLISLDGFPGDSVRAMATDPSGHVWIGTESGIGKLSGESLIDQTPGSETENGNVVQMAFASDGALWVRGGGKLRRLENGAWSATAKGIPRGFNGAAGSDPLQMLPGENGGVWLLQRHAGVLHVDRAGEIDRIDSQDGLPSGLVECGLVDREGSLWVGFNGGGLAQIRPRFLDRLFLPEDPNAVVRSICEDHHGDLWTGHSDGRLVHWREGVGKIFPLPDIAGNGDQRPRRRDLIAWPDRDENLWIGTVGTGAWILRNGDLERPFPSGAIGDVVRAGLTDTKGNVWLGSERGLFRYAEGKLHRFDADGGFEDSYVVALAESPDGAVWVGTANGGLWRFRDGEFDHWRLPGDQEFRFWALHAGDDGTIWVGTLAAGLLRWKDGQLGRATSADGLPNDTVTQILTDSHGTLWAGSRHGLFSVPLSDLHRFYDGEKVDIRARLFTLSAGLPAMEFSGGSHPACAKASDGRLWFSTVKGAIAVRPGEIPSNPSPPAVLIEALRINDELQELGDLELPPGNHTCEFRFTTPSFVAPEKIRFQWRLDGADSDWVDGGDSRQARYPSLGAGKYTFRARARNDDGVWNKAGTLVVMTIAPYYWQTLWFRILAPTVILGGAASLLWLFLRRKHLREIETMNRVQLVQAERTRIARDLHDDLGASLTQITWLCEAAKDRPASGETVEIAQIGTKSREMVRSIDEIVWAVSPHNDTLDALAHYICQFAEDFLKNTDIRCRLDVDESLPEHTLDSAVRHDLFLAAREAIHNAARHSGASEVKIDIHASDSRAEIRIADNGSGFNPDRDRGGNGMRNMQARAAAAGASFDLQSAAGKGSEISFTIRLDLRIK